MWLQIIILSVLICTRSVCAIAGQSDCVFIEAARLDVVWPPPSAEMIKAEDLSLIHRISSGAKTVALLRTFTPREGGEIDSEQYWKLSIELPNIRVGNSVSLAASSGNTRFSRGGSAWVHNGAGNLSADVAGKIIARRIDNDTMALDLDLHIEARAADAPQEKSAVPIKRRYMLRRLSISKLTPWLGSATAGATDRDTTYRSTQVGAGCIDS